MRITAPIVVDDSDNDIAYEQDNIDQLHNKNTSLFSNDILLQDATPISFNDKQIDDIQVINNNNGVNNNCTKKSIFPSNVVILPHQSVSHNNALITQQSNITYKHTTPSNYRSSGITINNNNGYVIRSKNKTINITSIEQYDSIQTTQHIVNDIRTLIELNDSMDNSIDNICNTYKQNYQYDTLQYAVYDLIQILHSHQHKSLNKFDIVNERNQATIQQYIIKHDVSAWLQKQCEYALQDTLNDIINDNKRCNTYSHIICLLCMNHINEACNILQEYYSDNIELILLTSEIGQSNNQTQHDITLQLKQWYRDGTIHNMSTDEIIIYKLISGNVVDVAYALTKKYKLHWLNIFGLFLWYNKNTLYNTLTDTLAAYTEYFTTIEQHNDADIVVPLSLYSIEHLQSQVTSDIATDVYDIRFNILSLYCNTDITLNQQLYQQIISSLSYSYNTVDIHLSYHIHQIYSLIDLNIEYTLYDNKLAIDYCTQLEYNTLWYFAVYIAYKHDLYDIINNLLHRHIIDLYLPIDQSIIETLYADIDYEQYNMQQIDIIKPSIEQQAINTSIIELITSATNITIQQLYTIKAEHKLHNAVSKNYIQYHSVCCSYIEYILAQDYTIAHDILLQYILPCLILNNKWLVITNESQRLQSNLSDDIYNNGIGLYILYKHTVDSVYQYMNEVNNNEQDIDKDSIHNMLDELKHILNQLSIHYTIQYRHDNVIQQTASQIVNQQLLHCISQLQHVLALNGEIDTLDIPDSIDNQSRQTLLDSHVDNVLLLY